MEFIQIPAPDFNFETIIKQKVSLLTKNYITLNNISNPYISTPTVIRDEIQKVLWELPEKKQIAFFINELIIHVNLLKKKYDDDKEKYLPKNKAQLPKAIEQHNESLQEFDSLLFHLYNLLTQNGFTIDKDVFTFEEAFDINIKLNEIISTLEILKMGHEALGAEIQDVKDQLNSLNNSTPLGKKSFYQRATGIAVHFATDKTLEIIWEPIKPHFTELLLTKVPIAIGNILAFKH